MIISTKKLAAAAVALASLSGTQLFAASLDGLTIKACVDSSVDTGSVSADPSKCDFQTAQFSTDSAVVGAGVEFVMGSSGRTADFSGDTISITYTDRVSSASPDMFIFSGLSGVTGLSLLTANDLNIETAFTPTTIGFLVNAPLFGNATVSYRIEMGSPSNVPLPAGALLLPTALAGLHLARRRKKA